MIAIPNMDKPQSCWECPFYDSEYPWTCDSLDTDCPIIEIIPCKECKFSHMTYDGQCKYCDLERDDDDNFIECYFDGDHFCGFGERRSDADRKTEENM